MIAKDFIRLSQLKFSSNVIEKVRSKFNNSLYSVLKVNKQEVK